MKRSTLLLAALAALAACTDAGPTAGPGDPPPSAEGFAASTELGRGFILGRAGTPVAVTFQVVDGRAIFEGDIDLGPAASIARTAEELTRRQGPSYGITVDGGTKRWPNRVIPYVIDAAVPNPSRVTDAIAHIEATTNLDFVARTTQTDYVRVTTVGANCYSVVGRQGGEQLVQLSTSCDLGRTAHEFLHAAGMDHEQSRCDRDSYVEIRWANIQPGLEPLFDKLCDGYTDVFSYDEGSIMHYAPTIGTWNGLPTIVSKRGRDSQMGQRTALSANDIATVNWMYPIPAPTVTSVASNPSPAKQYLPFSITINGSGFDPSTVEIRLLGAGSCPSPGCTPTSYSTKTSTQLVISSFSLSQPGTYTVNVRNGPTGLWSTNTHTVTLTPMY